MARIRSIKPEFPQSESMGNISRDSRLTFLLLWTIADDAGRLRGNSRMLASLLFPYDDDAPGLINCWLDELENEGCILRYLVEGNSFIQICNWFIHQKIDKPSVSKLPEFSNTRESSRILPVGREGKGEEGKGEEAETPIASVADDHKQCPHQEIIEIYHQVLPQCPRIRDWTPARATQLRARWNEDPKRQNLEYWKMLFEYISACDFLVGKSGKTPFFADLEWIVKSGNFVKIREGKYNNREAA